MSISLQEYTDRCNNGHFNWYTRRELGQFRASVFNLLIEYITANYPLEQQNYSTIESIVCDHNEYHHPGTTFFDVKRHVIEEIRDFCLKGLGEPLNTSWKNKQESTPPKDEKSVNPITLEEYAKHWFTGSYGKHINRLTHFRKGVFASLIKYIQENPQCLLRDAGRCDEQKCKYCGEEYINRMACIIEYEGRMRFGDPNLFCIPHKVVQNLSDFLGNNKARCGCRR